MTPWFNVPENMQLSWIHNYWTFNSARDRLPSLSPCNTLRQTRPLVFWPDRQRKDQVNIFTGHQRMNAGRVMGRWMMTHKKLLRRPQDKVVHMAEHFLIWWIYSSRPSNPWFLATRRKMSTSMWLSWHLTMQSIVDRPTACMRHVKYTQMANGLKFCNFHSDADTWLAIIPGDILPMSPSSGHLGQRNVRQKLHSVSGLVGFSVVDRQREWTTAAQSKVVEQLGQDKINGSHPRYLWFHSHSASMH